MFDGPLPPLLTPLDGKTSTKIRELGFAVQDYAPHFPNTMTALQVSNDLIMDTASENLFRVIYMNVYDLKLRVENIWWLSEGLFTLTKKTLHICNPLTGYPVTMDI